MKTKLILTVATVALIATLILQSPMLEIGKYWVDASIANNSPKGSGYYIGYNVFFEGADHIIESKRSLGIRISPEQWLFTQESSLGYLAIIGDTKGGLPHKVDFIPFWNRW